MAGRGVDKPAAHHPPNRGQEITAKYLRQEFRRARQQSTPLDGQTTRWFYAPPGGIAAPTVSGREITPAKGACVPARWTGEKWVPDPDGTTEQVSNSWEGETVASYARIQAVWSYDHWELGPYACNAMTP